MRIRIPVAGARGGVTGRQGGGRRRAAGAAAACAVLLTAVGCAGSATGQAGGGSAAGSASPTPKPSLTSVHAQCQTELKTGCYTFDQLRTAYGVDRLAQGGLSGAGERIAVVMATGSPTLQSDLNTISDQLGIARTTLRVIEQKPPDGAPVAPFDYRNKDLVAEAHEATMDVQATHAMAPGAQIILYQVDVDQAQADSGLTADVVRRMAQGVRDLVDQDAADVISLSFVSAEQGPTAERMTPLYKEMQPEFRKAAQAGITVVAAAGDDGAAPTEGTAGQPLRGVAWPASDPNVVAVGGTRLLLDDAGHRTAPDTVWDDKLGATGGGLSTVFPRPAYQNGIASIAGPHRAVPDVSLTASGDGSTMIYFTMAGVGQWVPMVGTSLAAPLFAGMVALADQRAGRRLGNVDTLLYPEGSGTARAAGAGIVDVTSGENGPGGYRAVEGYDLASGLGTVDATKLVAALASAGGGGIHSAAR